MRILYGFFLMIIGGLGLIGAIFYVYMMLSIAAYCLAGSWTCSTTTYLYIAGLCLLAVIFGICFAYLAIRGDKILKRY